MFDGFTLDGEEYWLVEDGGRLRHCETLGGAWTFQPVPDVVKDTLHRVFFLTPEPNQSPTIGWAVGQDGHVIKTTDGGDNWSVYATVASVLPDSDYEDLFDAHFLDEGHGWVVGTHGIFLFEDEGSGLSITPATLLGADSEPLDPASIELYAIDIAPADGGGYYGLAVGQPGLVLKATGDLDEWTVVWDIRDFEGNTHFYPLTGCEQAIFWEPGPGEEQAVFEPWDVEISRHPTENLAILVGGIFAQCGMIFSSTNEGATWGKEYHECQSGNQDCSQDPLYNDDPTEDDDTWRHQNIKTLYGVSIFHDTNVAIAAGYNAQHLVRNATTHEWEDRSSFTDEMFSLPNPVVFPFQGAAAGRDGKAVLTGCGGHIRVTEDHGQTWEEWNPADPGVPYRVNDVYFISDTTGFLIGQAGRMGRSTNGGSTFPTFGPSPGLLLADLVSITFAPDGQHGVIVGGPYPDVPGQPNPDKPRVIHTSTSGDDWSEPAANAITLLERASAGKELRDVDWSAGQEYWAAGNDGLIMHGNSWGATWSQCRPTDAAYDELEEFEMFDFEGVSFIDGSTGVFVGTNSDTDEAFAYELHVNGSNVSWTDLVANLDDLTNLQDVTIAGNAAYAVGTKVTGSPPERQGVVLRSEFSSGAFGQFAVVTGVPACTVGEDLRRVAVMHEIEYVAATGELWIGGECGRVWRCTIDGSGFSKFEQKSQTDAHILGISFSPSGAKGYFAGQRLSYTQQSVVKVSQ